ncbi:alpha/beta hydrolase [Seongchinamella unica]|uniref:Alpha/beta hydrolase n=1 Tax=Seongchinamella unica TaxID=2547392 RepID=A0A4V2ZWV4_9GAMM|nr:alpha/beta hydrolase [Seongchinamella unica]TDG11818.1 alpha/beta hydrolase [Seongchinamella unica]
MPATFDTTRGGTRLLFDSIAGITTTVESMHRKIARTAVPWPVAEDRAHGAIAAAVYRLILGVNDGLRQGVDWTFGQTPEALRSGRESAAEVRAIAALNGVCGDHLEATDNPLGTDMQLRTAQQRLVLEPPLLREAIPEASGHLVVLVHGLSMSELGWRRRGRPCIDEQLGNDLGYTPLFLRYNSGRHISTNGREFASMLQALCDNWPVPVESLSLIGHSMGGLVIRSTCRYAQLDGRDWLHLLRRVVCLGTPHHGSPLEQAGHAFEQAMRRVPYAEPMLFGKLRSAGIKDLRHGNLLDEDWQGHDPDAPRPDSRQAVPLLNGVDYYFAAASLGRNQFDPLGHLLGDLLVRADSAVGLHRDELRRLDIRPEHCRVFHGRNHFDLLDDPQVHQQVIDWFSR